MEISLNSLKQDLLIEFLAEELPPIHMEQNIGQAFCDNLYKELRQFILDEAKPSIFITPRRFGCILYNVLNYEKTQVVKKKGPAIKIGLNNNQPTQALLGFAKSCNDTSWQQLEQNADGYFYYTQTVQGQSLIQVLPEAIINSLKKISTVKSMTWNDGCYRFIRPLHNLMLIYGNNPVHFDTAIMGLKPVGYTFGHRFMSEDKIVINQTNNYEQTLKDHGFVIANFAKRQQEINDALILSANSLKLNLNHMQGLLEEVTAIVEYPVVLSGEFDPLFLEVPQECLILSMAKHQKYFALIDNEGQLSNKFLFVANLISSDPKVVIQGNQKVLSARLADARFFYNNDKKRNLNEFIENLTHVIYHNKLGSQFERVIRLQNIASAIAQLMNDDLNYALDANIVRHTAYLLKADLTTEMVQEFPQLQGIMGKYYALKQGEGLEIANAIEKHYYPRFSGDTLPQDPLSTVMALTDKLETIIGIWGINLAPTGEKDPFALRRAALGIVRILLNNNLNIKKLLAVSFAAFISKKISISEDILQEIYRFILQRLYYYLTNINNYSANCVQSIVSLSPNNFAYIPGLLIKLQQFVQDSNNARLLGANKRIENIIKKNDYSIVNSTIQANLLIEDSEKEIASLLETIPTIADKFANLNDWDNYFKQLAKFNQVTDNFFMNVMVIAEDLSLRNNRLLLLKHLYSFLNKYCKLSELV